MINNLQQKVHWLTASAVIIALAIVAAWAISTRATANAIAGIQFAGIVTTYNPLCILDTPPKAPVLCGISCPRCAGAYGPRCATMEEVAFKAFPGSNTDFVCPPKGFPYIGQGAPFVGAKILGAGISKDSLWQISTSR